MASGTPIHSPPAKVLLKASLKNIIVSGQYLAKASNQARALTLALAPSLAWGLSLD